MLDSGGNEVARWLLDHGADPNVREMMRATPLASAVNFANLEGVKLLLARGADPNASDEAGRTALYWNKMTGAQGNKGEIRQALLDAGARESP